MAMTKNDKNANVKNGLRITRRLAGCTFETLSETGFSGKSEEPEAQKLETWRGTSPGLSCHDELKLRPAGKCCSTCLAWV